MQGHSEAVIFTGLLIMASYGGRLGAKLKVQLKSERAKLPIKGSASAAGYDLYSAESVAIPRNESATVSTDIAISVPDGTYGRVAPRSGLAFKYDIDVAGGVIDQVRFAQLTCRRKKS